MHTVFLQGSDVPAVQPVPETRVVEECYVENVARFVAFSDGSLRIVFDDRTGLDMYGLQWETHVYECLLQGHVSFYLLIYFHCFILGSRLRSVVFYTLADIFGTGSDIGTVYQYQYTYPSGH